jgi:hypothetical protein
MNESGLVYVGEKTGSSRAVYDHVVNEYPCLFDADEPQRKIEGATGDGLAYGLYIFS